MQRHRWSVSAGLLTALLGAQVVFSSSIITTPYNGADRLVLHTDAGPHADGYGPGGMTDNGGVTYKQWGGDQHTPSMLDGVFSGDKNFPNSMTSSTLANMDSQDPSGTWFWWNAHFDKPIVISHFVIRTADHSRDRIPDQFQLRGLDDSGSWHVIYRYNQNEVGVTPWGTWIDANTDFANNTAVLFDGDGVDFATPAGYKQIRFELFSALHGDGVGITEWQLAGVVYKPAGVLLIAR